MPQLFEAAFMFPRKGAAGVAERFDLRAELVVCLSAEPRAEIGEGDLRHSSFYLVWSRPRKLQLRGGSLLDKQLFESVP